MEHGDEDRPLTQWFVWNSNDLYWVWSLGVPHSHHSSPDGGSVGVSTCPPSPLVSVDSFMLQFLLQRSTV